MTRSEILVLRALGLGDFVTGLPALQLLRVEYPDRHIILAAPSWLRPVAKLCGLVDGHVHGAELQPLVEPPKCPELAIDLHGNGPASRALLEPCRPRRLLAYAGSSIRWRCDEHEVDRWCRLLREGLGIDRPTPSLAGILPPPPVDAPQGRTILHCGAKAAARRWPAARFTALAVHLAAEGHDVAVTGGPGETELARRIARSAGVPAMTDLSLLALLALIAQARLLVSGDTGVAHVASAYGTPSVVLFGPVSPRVWGPPDHPRHQVVWRGDGAGDPHASRIDPALARISVHDVCSAVAMAERRGVRNAGG